MINPSELRHFCGHLVRKYGSPDKASEDQKADEFRQYYLRNLPPTVRSLRAVAHCCGLRVNKSDYMPTTIRGYNHVVNGTDNIVVRDGDTVSGTQNTILHEIREIMERIFPGVCCDYDPLKTNALHIAANKFATAVLLPGETFRKKVYKVGFDVIELANSYSKSCSQVLLRIGEVLQGKLFFYACMYEPDPDDNWKVTYWTGSNNHDDLDANVYGLNGFFPRKHRAVAPGSLVEMVIKEGKPHLVERITLHDDGEDEGLVAIANPLLIQGKPVKVMLTVLLSSDGELLSPQVDRLNPVTIERFYQHL
jgi:hypothetical protein